MKSIYPAGSCIDGTTDVVPCEIGICLAEGEITRTCIAGAWVDSSCTLKTDAQKPAVTDHIFTSNDCIFIDAVRRNDADSCNSASFNGIFPALNESEKNMCVTVINQKLSDCINMCGNKDAKDGIFSPVSYSFFCTDMAGYPVTENVPGIFDESTIYVVDFSIDDTFDFSKII